jgi:hypothetical protein
MNSCMNHKLVGPLKETVGAAFGTHADFLIGASGFDGRYANQGRVSLFPGFAEFFPAFPDAAEHVPRTAERNLHNHLLRSETERASNGDGFAAPGPSGFICG